MARRDAAGEYLAGVEYELNNDRARVLGRYGGKVEAAIATCQALLDDIDAGNTTAAETYKESRRAALQAIDDLCFQREMLGLVDHARVHEIYRVPAPLDDRHGASTASQRQRDARGV